MKKIFYLYILTFDNRIKYYVDPDNTTYNHYNAMMFETKAKAQKVADKSQTMWKVGIENAPKSILHLFINYKKSESWNNKLKL